MTGQLVPGWVMESVQQGIADGEAAIRARQESERLDAERRVREAAEQALYAAAVPLLDGATDPAWRAVLDLHHREAAWEGSDRFYCVACPGGCCDTIGWPCSTVRLAAEHLGIELPDDPYDYGMDRPKDGSLDPKETQ